MKKLFTLFLTILIVSDITYASEYATFESFYKESSVIGWILAGVVALILGAVIIITGGTASPIVASTGAWIGGMMGFSGAVATNAGLALLGGGSIASGGFGMLGGVAVLTAALSFSTEVVFDYTVSKTISEYKYSQLAKESENMLTLPLPINNSGTDAYEEVLEKFEDYIDKKKSIYSSPNQELISYGINFLEFYMDDIDINESVQNDTLLSLLYFISNDYKNANKYAESAIQSARKVEIKRTLPAFIYATSALYDRSFDFNRITSDYFRYAIIAEPDNPLTPLLFSIYLDRMTLRFDDGFLDGRSFERVFSIMKEEDIKKYRVQNYTIIMSKYFMRIKLEQQKITSLTSKDNKTIKNSKKTLDAVAQSLKQYRILLDGADNAMNYFIALDLEDEGRVKRSEFHELLIKYKKDRGRLKMLVSKLKEYQDNLVKVEVKDSNQADSSNWTVYLFAFLVFIFGFITLKNAKKIRGYKH